MKKRKRNLNICIEMLTRVWLKWLKYNNIARNNSISLKEKYKAAKICEKMLCYRIVLISEIDDNFEKIFNNKNTLL